MYRRLGSRTAGEDQELGVLAWKTRSGVSSGRRPVAIAACTYGGPAIGTDHRAGLTGYLALAPPPETAPVARMLSVRIDLPELLDARCRPVGGPRGVRRGCPSLRVTSVDWPRLERSAGSESCHRRWRSVACAVVDPRSLRLVFGYDERGVRLLSRTPRGSPAPPSAALTEPPPGAITLELRSRSGEVRYRRFLLEPIRQTLETVGDQGRLRRIPFAPPSGAFSAVVIPPAPGDVVVVSAGPAVRFAQPALRPRPGPPAWRELLNTSAERP